MQKQEFATVFRFEGIRVMHSDPYHLYATDVRRRREECKVHEQYKKFLNRLLSLLRKGWVVDYEEYFNSENQLCCRGTATKEI